MLINNETLKKIENRTLSNYEGVKVEENHSWINDFNTIGMIEDLLCEIENLEEEISDIKQERDEYYELKKENPYVEYGVSENEFH